MKILNLERTYKYNPLNKLLFDLLVTLLKTPRNTLNKN